MKRKIILLALITLLAMPISANAKEYNVEYEDYIEEVCAGYNLCPELVEAIIFYESSWTETAKSSAGCIGLMQIHPSSHKARMKRLNVTDLTDGKQNILVGCDYLAELFREYEDIGKVLDAYAGCLKSDEWYLTHRTSKHNELVLELSADLEEKHGKLEVNING